MIDLFVGMESDFLESFGDELLFAPVDVPVVILSLTIVPFFHGSLDAVGEVSFELDLGAKLGKFY